MAETILVADDEVINRLVLTTMLKKHGYVVQEARDGREALAAASETSEPPDMVLLDVMMPGIDGFEVLVKLKSDSRTAAIPVILITALNGTEDILRGITCGADEFITKPIDVNELLVRVRSILKIRSLNDYMEKNSILNECVRNFTQTAEIEDQFQGYDIEWVLSNILEVNLRGGTNDKGKPKYIYSKFELPDYHCRPTLYRREGTALQRTILPGEFLVLEPERLGLRVEEVFLSNWRQAAKNLELYRENLPAWLNEECGGIENFLYYKGNDFQLAFINYSREIKPFDITWFRHLVRYSGALVALLGRMTRKETEYLALANALSNIIEIKDEALGRHQTICRIVDLLCRELACSQGFITTLKDAIRLFDIGKILIDQNVLLKNRPLSEAERDLIKRMPEYAATILTGLPRLATAKEIAAGISEHWDGSGYPEGLKGEEIPLSARIVAVVNVYDSLRRNRSYRRNHPHEETLKILREGDDRQRTGKFDPRVLEAFLRISDGVKALYD